ncbi:MAG: glycosyltransferase family 2 protein [Betaproteobacteria bacterium]
MRISVVTPSLNQAPFLEACLQSVAAQRGCDVEHVVYDGGSTDGSVAILERWNGRVRWVSQRDRGQSDAVNQAIGDTQGEIVGWLNSDDFYYPNAFAAVLAAFRADDRIDVVYGEADHVDIDGLAYERYPTEAWDGARLADTCFVCQPALFFRRRIIAAVGLLDEALQFCMDYEYWMRFADAGLDVRYIPQRLAASRMHATNKTLGSRVSAHAEINGMLRKRLGATPDHWLFSYGHAVASRCVRRERFPRIYGGCMAGAALFAALRWNARVSAPMRRTIGALVAKKLTRRH